MHAADAVGRLQAGDHVCWTYEDDRHPLEVVARYIRDGLAQGHRVVYYTHSLLPEALTAGLEAAGIPVVEATGAGQLTIATATDAYLADGGFDPRAVLAAWQAEQDAARAAGWSGLRAAGDMAWAAGTPMMDDLLAYEAQVNTLFAGGYAMGLCLYDRRLFTAAEVAGIGSAHLGTAGASANAGWEPAVRIRYTTSPAGLRLSGEVDASNRRAVAAVLAALAPDGDSGADSVVMVDVSQLAIVDGATAAGLVRAAQAAGGRLRLVGASPLLRRLIDMVSAGQAPMMVERAA